MAQIKLKIVEVLWRDHIGFNGWVDLADCINEKEDPAMTVGYLIYEDKKAFFLAQSISETGDYGDVIKILKATIVRKRCLV